MESIYYGMGIAVEPRKKLKLCSKIIKTLNFRNQHLQKLSPENLLLPRANIDQNNYSNFCTFTFPVLHIRAIQKDISVWFADTNAISKSHH